MKQLLKQNSSTKIITYTKWKSTFFVTLEPENRLNNTYRKPNTSRQHGSITQPTKKVAKFGRDTSGGDTNSPFLAFVSNLILRVIMRTLSVSVGLPESPAVSPIGRWTLQEERSRPVQADTCGQLLGHCNFRDSVEQCTMGSFM